jgi:hypothetical protein
LKEFLWFVELDQIIHGKEGQKLWGTEMKKGG